MKGLFQANISIHQTLIAAMSNLDFGILETLNTLLSHSLTDIFSQVSYYSPLHSENGIKFKITHEKKTNFEEIFTDCDKWQERNESRIFYEEFMKRKNDFSHAIFDSKIENHPCTVFFTLK